MMQGTILTGIRGNDLGNCPKLKPVVRWIRSVVVVNGNKENDFMQVKSLPAVEDFEDELEYLSVHYFRHLLHTLEIIGYMHPDYDISSIAFEYYLRLVDWCHLQPESRDHLEERLSGKPGTTGTAQPWGVDPEAWDKLFNRKQPPKRNRKAITPVPDPLAGPVIPIHKNRGGSSY